MNKYIKSRKHKSTNYLGASIVTAGVLLTTPIMLNASTTLEQVDVVEKSEKINYSENYKVDKSSSACTKIRPFSGEIVSKA